MFLQRDFANKDSGGYLPNTASPFLRCEVLAQSVPARRLSFVLRLVWTFSARRLIQPRLFLQIIYDPPSFSPYQPVQGGVFFQT